MCTLLACPCGSIMSGHLRALKTMMPLSTLKPSVGSPSMFHCRTSTGSPSVPDRGRVSVSATLPPAWFDSRMSSDPTKENSNPQKLRTCTMPTPVSLTENTLNMTQEINP